jgi:N6-adenosine-specific RNA methylase IME4
VRALDMSTQHASLVKLDRASRMLAEIRTVDDVRAVVDMAEAARVYAAQVLKSQEAQNEAAEIKLRAQRRGGEILTEMSASGARRSRGERRQMSQASTSERPDLGDLGITRDDSSRWQTIAAMPQEKFEAVIAEAKDTPGAELTTAAVLRAAKIDARPRDVAPPKLPDGQWDVILADPPWQYDFAPTESRAVENQYTTLSVDRIIALAPHGKPVNETFAETAVLYLWATAPKLREGLAVLEGWGFEYKTHAIWDKEKIGMGHWFRGQHELLLVGTRGDFSPPPQEQRIGSVLRAPRGTHSAKPTIVHECLERWFPRDGYLELFGRARYSDKWTVWGIDAP